MAEVVLGLLLIYLFTSLLVGIIIVTGAKNFQISYAQAFTLSILWPLLPVCFLFFSLCVVVFDIYVWWQSRKQ